MSDITGAASVIRIVRLKTFMDTSTKLAFGRILGEIYRLQKHTPGMTCPVGDAEIYGLLNGFEQVLNEAVSSSDLIPESKFDHLSKVLTAHWEDPKKLEAFSGFYTIERELEAGGVSRSDAIAILTYLKANDNFEELISKMDSNSSPTECRTFKIHDCQS